MAIERKRIYELENEGTLTDTHDLATDKIGNDEAKRFSLLNLYNYIKAKIVSVTSLNPIESTDKFLMIRGDELYYESARDTRKYMIDILKDFELKTPLDPTDIITIYDPIEEEFFTANISEMAGGSNIATNDLVFTADSTTNFAGWTATFDNAELKIIADGNTSGDTPFEVTLADGTTSILKVTGDKKMLHKTDANGGFTISSSDLNPLITLTSDSTANTYGPFIDLRDSSGRLAYIQRRKSNFLDIITTDPTYGIKQTIRGVEPIDITLDNDTYCVFYDGTDLKIKFKNSSGTVITKTIS
jgi:hypothetical protein